MTEKSVRMTIMIDSDLARKIRNVQASRIRKSRKNVSFSQVIEDLARIGLKYSKDKSLQLITQTVTFAGIFTGICCIPWI